MNARLLGPQLQRELERCNRLLKVLLPPKDDPEIVRRIGTVRVSLHGFSEPVCCLTEAAFLDKASAFSNELARMLGALCLRFCWRGG